MGRSLNAPISSVSVQGVVFSVRPPRKSWKAIANLSGGEKTLASLALVFALHHYKPTPLYVMDEIDAALGAAQTQRGPKASFHVLHGPVICGNTIIHRSEAQGCLPV